MVPSTVISPMVPPRQPVPPPHQQPSWNTLELEPIHYPIPLILATLPISLIKPIDILVIPNSPLILIFHSIP